jgi:ribosomal protein RSM22 (predicted rRNA methylase)
MELPPDLVASLSATLRGTPTGDIVRAGSALSMRYRARQGHSSHGQGSALQSSLDAIAYAAYRLPATYAAIRAVFREVRERRPEFQPATLLDFGGGPGTAAWAAIDAWPEIDRVTILERDPRMLDVGKALAAKAVSPAIRQALWKTADIAAAGQVSPANLTVAGYVMGEIPEATRVDIVRGLWERTTDTCVIVEPGTPRGYALIREVTEQLAQAGAHVLAPVPAGWRCVESIDDWCHFSQRVPRTSLLRSVKGGALSYEDEKYSYVAVSRVEGIPIAARVIRHPQVRSGHIRLVLCTPAGVHHVVVARSNREAYRRARDLRWGSAISVEEAGMYGLDEEVAAAGV